MKVFKITLILVVFILVLFSVNTQEKQEENESGEEIEVDADGNFDNDGIDGSIAGNSIGGGAHVSGSVAQDGTVTGTVKSGTAQVTSHAGFQADIPTGASFSISSTTGAISIDAPIGSSVSVSQLSEIINSGAYELSLTTPNGDIVNLEPGDKLNVEIDGSYETSKDTGVTTSKGHEIKSRGGISYNSQKDEYDKGTLEAVTADGKISCELPAGGKLSFDHPDLESTRNKVHICDNCIAINDDAFTQTGYTSVSMGGITTTGRAPDTLIKGQGIKREFWGTGTGGRKIVAMTTIGNLITYQQYMNSQITTTVHPFSQYFTQPTALPDAILIDNYGKNMLNVQDNQITSKKTEITIDSMKPDVRSVTVSSSGFTTTISIEIMYSGVKARVDVTIPNSAIESSKIDANPAENIKEVMKTPDLVVDVEFIPESKIAGFFGALGGVDLALKNKFQELLEFLPIDSPQDRMNLEKVAENIEINRQVSFGKNTVRVGDLEVQITEETTQRIKDHYTKDIAETAKGVIERDEPVGRELNELFSKS